MLIALVELPLHNIRNELALQSIAKALCSEKRVIRRSAFCLIRNPTDPGCCILRARLAVADPLRPWLPEHPQELATMIIPTWERQGGEHIVYF